MNHEEHEGHKEHEGVRAELESVARTVVDAGLKVHRVLGPGLLESAYEQCLAHELQKRSISIRRQVALPVVYEGLRLDAGYRLDVIEVKAAEALTRLHEAQVLTHLKLSGCRLGFLMNFNVMLFKQGLRRMAF